MPEHFRALIIILFFATIFFAFARQSACAIAGTERFTRRRNIWFAMTLTAFLAYSFWIYTTIIILLLIYARRYEAKPLSLFFFTLFVLPLATVPVPGLGVINYLIELSHARILTLFVLLPAFLVLRRQSDTIPFGRTWTDKALAAVFLLTAILNLRETSLTDTLRQIFYLFLDVFLPYFVISRSLKNLEDFRDAVLSLLVAIMVLAPLAIFESNRSWLLYASVSRILQLEGMATAYLGRGDSLRAITTAGHPIALGYLMVVGIGLYFFLQRSIQQKLVRRLGMALLAGGLFASVSRGPWVGAAVLLVVFIATGRNAVRNLLRLALAVMIVFPLVSQLPGGDKIINLLPYIGSTDTGNVEYRENLFTNALVVIQDNLWFGSVDYNKTPEMTAMLQGEGIIDIVNTYIGIALKQGIIGLGLFIAVFALTLWSVYRAMRSIPDKTGEEYLLGRALVATLLGIMVTITTVSSITIIPIVYWSVVGLGVAYAQMLMRK